MSVGKANAATSLARMYGTNIQVPFGVGRMMVISSGRVIRGMWGCLGLGLEGEGESLVSSLRLNWQ
jgi:hypothetical protein